MPEIICNTSPMQYLHQLELLHILPVLAEQVIVPPAVVNELAAGRALGLNLPDPTALSWVTVRHPVSAPALPLVTDLGSGETEVLMLALESPEALGLHLTGTLGLLLDAKKAGLIPAVKPVLDQLQALRFRLAPHTRTAVLKLAGEEA